MTLHSPGVLVALSVVMLALPLVASVWGFVLLTAGRPLRSMRALGWITLGVCAVQLGLSIALVVARPAPPLTFSASFALVTVDFRLDALSVYFVLLVNIIALFAAANSFAYLGPEPEEGSRGNAFFHASVNAFHFTMLLVPMVDNLIGLWIAIEMTTLFSAFLVGLENQSRSWEAAWKYLVITSTGIILALLGTMFLANALPRDVLVQRNAVPLDRVMNWSFLMDLARSDQLSGSADFVRLAFLFALVGFGTKAGLAPMHTWLPDGHGEAPAPISALLSGVLLKSALYAILRFYTITNTVLGSTTFTSRVLLGAGLLSLLVAVPFILKPNNYFKRVLAYHSLEHMGIIVLGLGIGGPVAIFGALLHALNHALTKSLMFLSFGNVLKRYKCALCGSDGELEPPPDWRETELRGLIHTMPFTAGLLSLGGLALLGAPPFNIFMSEFIILWGALQRFGQGASNAIPTFPDWVMAVTLALFVASTTIIFLGLVRHLARHILGSAPFEGRLPEPPADLAPLLGLMALVLLLGVWITPPLSRLIQDSVAIVLEMR